MIRPSAVGERAALERERVRVHLVDRQHLGRDALGVLGLDDAVELPVRVADDAAERIGVVTVDRDHGGRGPGPAVKVDQARDQLGGDERVIAVHDHDGLRVADQVERRPHRAAGSVGLRLDDGLGALREGVREVAVGRGDHADAPRAGLARGEHRPGDHRSTADRVQHLRHRRAHPGALAGGHDQHGGTAHLRNRRAVDATRAPKGRHDHECVFDRAILRSIALSLR